MAEGEKNLYLTKKGWKNLKKECKELERVKFSKIEGNFPEPFHPESVNPEYLSYYEELDLIENKLAKINNILKNAELIKTPPRGKRNIVNLGARVILEENGETDEFEIVGPLEANSSLGRISNESPLGAAILGHKVGDKVMISSPIKIIYKIKNIKYNLIKKRQ